MTAVDPLDAGEPPSAEKPQGEPKPRRRQDEPVLPRSTRDDTDVGWGERPSDSDSWLREQRPPHWD